MNVLVAFASRHDNARGIAEAIAAELESSGHHTVFSDVSRVSSLAGFDAVVVGSGLYRGRWLPPTLAFLDRFRAQLATLPVWLFCSDPVNTRQGELPLGPESRGQAIHLMGHRCFPGSIAPTLPASNLPPAPRAANRPAREFRDWDAVSDWARGIGAAATPPPSATALPA